MSVLAIVPTFMRSDDDFEMARTTLASLRKTAPSVDILVVDDCSPNKKALSDLGGLRGELNFELDRSKENEGFARTVNVGLRQARLSGMDGLLVNADMFFFEAGWLEAMCAREESVVGAKLLFSNGLIQHAGIYYSIIGRVFDHRYKFAPHNLPLANEPAICPVTGALQLIKHECLSAVGLYDEDFRLGWEDVDYCHQVFQSGRLCVYEPSARAIHHESMIRANNPSQKMIDWQMQSWQRLHKKHAGHDFSEYVPTMLIDDEQL